MRYSKYSTTSSIYYYIQIGPDKDQLEIDSLEVKVTSDVELDGRNDTGDEFQEDEEGEVRFHLLSAFSHGIRHAFEHIGMFAWVDCRH